MDYWVLIHPHINIIHPWSIHTPEARLKPAPEPLIVLRNLRPEARGSLLRSPKRGPMDSGGGDSHPFYGDFP